MASIVEELGDLERLQKELEYLQTHAVKVGVLGNGSTNGVSVQEYAIFNEYGTNHIPSRPFFRLSVGTQKAQNEIKEYLNAQIENIVSGGLTGQGAYDNLGTFVVQKIKKTIMSGNFAPLDSKTIKRKGSSTPLVDTHSLYNSISYEIVGV
jgi:hypothetical protein